MLLPATLHEIFAARDTDSAASGGLALGLAQQAAPGKSLLWVRHGISAPEAGDLYPPGLHHWGVALEQMILVRVREPLAALQAGLEGARTMGLGAVIVELWGAAKAYDLTASRRLALASRASGVPVLVSRIAATPRPSCAEMRWRLRALPSPMLAARASGLPTFELTLLRARNTPEGISHIMQWNRDERRFAILPPDGASNVGANATRAAPLSGRLVSVSADRQAAPVRRHAG